MGDASRGADRVARAVHDLRRRRRRALAPEPPAPEDATIIERLEAVERALEELTRQLRAAPPAPAAAEPNGHAEPAGGVELDDPFGLLERDPGPPTADARAGRDVEA
jgi:hypothetical protein